MTKPGQILVTEFYKKDPGSNEIPEPVCTVSLEDYLNLEAQADMLAEALKFYANEKHWSNLIDVIYEGSYVSCSTLNKPDYGEYDQHNVRRAGKKAREALDKYTEFIRDSECVK